MQDELCLFTGRLQSHLLSALFTGGLRKLYVDHRWSWDLVNQASRVEALRRKAPPSSLPPSSLYPPQEAQILANEKEPVSTETTPLLWLATPLLVLEVFLLERWTFSTEDYSTLVW